MNGTMQHRDRMRTDRPVRRIDVFARSSAGDNEDGPGWLLLSRHEGPGMTAEQALRRELALSATDPELIEDGLVLYDGDLLVGILRVGARGPELIDLESR